MKAGILIFAALALGLNACGTQSNSKTAAAPVATVAGQPISQGLFNYYLTKKTGTAPDKLDAALKASLLEDLKHLKAAALVGEAQADPTTEEEIELQRLELLAHGAARAAGVYTSPSDAELQAEYDRFKSTFPAQEFHAAHILMATENAAAALIVKLQAGADFAKLAREDSADDSSTRGGDLGWIAPGKLPAGFTDAVKLLKPGQFTAHPVHTAYGWHIIKLVETRAAQAPPFEQVRAQLLINLQQSRYERFLDSATASVKIANGR